MSITICSDCNRLNSKIAYLEDVLSGVAYQEEVYTKTLAKELNQEMKIMNKQLKEENEKLLNDIKCLESVIETLCSQGIDYV